MNSFPFDNFFIVFAVLFAVVFAFIIFVFLRVIYNSVSQKLYNDSQPILTKNAKIIAKRTEMSGGGDSSVRTYHFVTFEFPENKERLELLVRSKDYGLVAENDLGKLTYQGRRYHNFERIIQ